MFIQQNIPLLLIKPCFSQATVVDDHIKLHLYSLPWRLDCTFSDTKFQRHSPKWITHDSLNYVNDKRGNFIGCKMIHTGVPKS